jgi:uncharacterized protein YcfJ
VATDRDCETAAAIAALETTVRLEGRTTRDAIQAVQDRHAACEARCSKHRAECDHSRSRVGLAVGAVVGGVLGVLGPIAWPWVRVLLEWVRG